MKYVFVILMLALVCSSCAPAQHITTDLVGGKYGFFGGLWHGYIAPFSFICSLFDSDIAAFAVNNTGRWYTFGFLIGVGGFTVTASSKTK